MDSEYLLDKNYIVLYYITLLWNRTGYLLVNESEGSPYNILTEKRVTQRSWQWGAEEKVGGRLFSVWTPWSQ